MSNVFKVFTVTGSSSFGETKISLTMSPERSFGQHWPSVVLGLLEAGQPQDTLTGGIANPAFEKIGSKE
jgi:hypothetical protein